MRWADAQALAGQLEKSDRGAAGHSEFERRLLRLPFQRQINPAGDEGLRGKFGWMIALGVIVVVCVLPPPVPVMVIILPDEDCATSFRYR